MDSVVWVLVFLLLAGATVYALLAHTSHQTSVKQVDTFPEVQSKGKQKKNSAKTSHGKQEKSKPEKKASEKKKKTLEEKKTLEKKKKTLEKKKKTLEKKQETKKPEQAQKAQKAQKPQKPQKAQKAGKLRSLPGSKGIVHAGGSKSFAEHNIEFDLPYLTEKPGRKALQIGILYRGTEYELEGCINDIDNVKNDLLTKIGFSVDHIIQITDDTKIKPTKANMMRALKQLATHTVDGDILFFQYSGHGTEVKDTSGDEADGFDEALCPLDGGVLIDDWIFAHFVTELEKKPKTRTFCLFDCCHSGTCMDLAFQYAAYREPKPYVKQIGDGKKSKSRKSKAHVVGFSAALDDQQAVDMQTGIPQGAFTNAFLQILKKHIKQRRSYRQFLLEVDQLLASEGFSHQASLSSSQPLDLDHELHLW